MNIDYREPYWEAWEAYFPASPKQATHHKHKSIDEAMGFSCQHCHAHVNSLSFISGVQNRNHCPYCLWSRHLDWWKAGDRLSACKGLMRPIGLTLKKAKKKYLSSQAGELMLIHHCEDCGKLSINRIAADDDLQNLYQVYKQSLEMEKQLKNRLNKEGISLLGCSSHSIVRARLFGQI